MTDPCPDCPHTWHGLRCRNVVYRYEANPYLTSPCPCLGPWGPKPAEENPRIIPSRHDDHCTDDACRGCQPCEEPHCRICIVTHVNGTCAECMAETREALHDIARMTDALPEEVEHRGVEGEAMMLLGPVADPEAFGHMSASVAAGRVSPDYLADAIGETHPVWVLGTWDMRWRDALDHDTTELVTLAASVDYLDRTMTYMGGYPHVSFEDFARDLRRCRTHLEAVLHDGEQVDQGAPCMSCGARLERTWGTDAKGDGWSCPRCKQTSTDAQYRFAVMHLHRESAEWLTDRDMEIRTGVKAGTVRVWARRGQVEKRRDSERTVYRVADVADRLGEFGA
jgi:hypothetical protein